jgi:hypothetical protein
MFKTENYQSCFNRRISGFQTQECDKICNLDERVSESAQN